MRERLTPLIPALFGLLLSACASQPATETAAAIAPATSTAPAATRTARSFSEIFDGPLSQPSSEQIVQTPSRHATFGSANEYAPQPKELAALGKQSDNPTVNRLLARAEQLIGTPYRTGGATTRGFDCSGFVNYLFKEEAGINLPRTSRDLMRMTKQRVARADLEPGDILLFNRNGRGRVSHTGIYLGDNRFIHSSSHRSGGVRIDSLDSRYWSKSYLDAKRVLN